MTDAWDVGLRKGRHQEPAENASITTKICIKDEKEPNRLLFCLERGKTNVEMISAIITSIGVSAILGMYRGTMKRLKNHEKCHETSDHTDMLLLREAIFRMHADILAEYEKTKKWNKHKIGTMIDLHKQYHELGGNGIVESYVNEIKIKSGFNLPYAQSY